MARRIHRPSTDPKLTKQEKSRIMWEKRIEMGDWAKISSRVDLDMAIEGETEKIQKLKEDTEKVLQDALDQKIRDTPVKLERKWTHAPVIPGESPESRNKRLRRERQARYREKKTPKKPTLSDLEKKEHEKTLNRLRVERYRNK